MEQRIAWDQLPLDLRAAVEKRTGPILDASTASAGENSPLAATITTADGKTFVKGVPSNHRRVVTQEREAAIAPLVHGLSPELRWHFDEAGWNVLGYEHIDGRHADYTPDSTDPEHLVPLMTALGEIELTEPGLFKIAEDRWKTYVGAPATARLFSGNALTHTDWAPHNVLITADGPRLIDWAWPTLGAAWTDPAHWIIRLIAAGHTAEQAEQLAARVPAYSAADPTHIDAFAAANVRLWDEIAHAAAGTRTWVPAMAAAARAWDASRRTMR